MNATGGGRTSAIPFSGIIYCADGGDSKGGRIDRNPRSCLINRQPKIEQQCERCGVCEAIPSLHSCIR